MIPVEVQLPNRPKTARVVGEAPEGASEDEVVKIAGLDPDDVVDASVIRRKGKARWSIVANVVPAAVPHGVHEPLRYAANTGREFDPSTEVHHFGFQVKIVDPGCTLEVQIEERDGRVTRLTTTDSPKSDEVAIREAIAGAAERFLDAWRLR